MPFKREYNLAIFCFFLSFCFCFFFGFDSIETGFKHVEVDALLNFKDTVVHFKKVKNEQKGVRQAILSQF